jgi:hypothetical protein
MPVVLVVLAVVGALLLSTNPGPEAFERFVAEEVSREVQALPGGVTELPGVLGDLGAVGGAALGRLARSQARRDNYHVASVYTLDLSGGRREGEQWRFLGILGRFVELERPERLR